MANLITKPIMSDIRGALVCRVPWTAPTSSGHIQVQGLVAQSYVRDPLAGRLASRPRTSPAFPGIDTRTLTRRLREHGLDRD